MSCRSLSRSCCNSGSAHTVLLAVTYSTLLPCCAQHVYGGARPCERVRAERRDIGRRKCGDDTATHIRKDADVAINRRNRHFSARSSAAFLAAAA